MPVSGYFSYLVIAAYSYTLSRSVLMVISLFTLNDLVELCMCMSVLPIAGSICPPTTSELRLFNERLKKGTEICISAKNYKNLLGLVWVNC